MVKSKEATRAAVLIVDDEASIRESLRMILEYESYRVDEAKSGSEALVKIAERPPDAVLLDIKMPEMDGLAVLSAMRERGYEMPVLMISGPRRRRHRGGRHPPRRLRLLPEAPRARAGTAVVAQRGRQPHRLQTENRVLRHEPDEMVGASPAMKRCARPSRRRRRPRRRC